MSDLPGLSSGVTTGDELRTSSLAQVPVFDIQTLSTTVRMSHIINSEHCNRKDTKAMMGNI